MEKRRSTGGCFMISRSRRPNRFQSRRWLVQMNGSLRLTITLSGRHCGNSKHLPQPAFGLVAGMATVPPAILRQRCSPMIPRAPSTRICTRIASCSTQPLIRWSNAGRHCKIMNCCAPENLPRTSITMNSPVNCGVLVIRFATKHAGISKSRACQKRFANAFPNGTRRLTRRWQNCWMKNRNWQAQTSRRYAPNWLLKLGRGNKRI